MAAITMSREELTAIMERNGAGRQLKIKLGLHLDPEVYSSKAAAVTASKNGGIIFYSSIGNKWMVTKSKSDADVLEKVVSFHRMD